MTNQESKSKKEQNYQGWEIVIIEDDEDLAKLIQLKLQQEGFKTMLAETGNDALSVVQGDPNEILLVDYRLPTLLKKPGLNQCIRSCRVIRENFCKGRH